MSTNKNDCVTDRHVDCVAASKRPHTDPRHCIRLRHKHQHPKQQQQQALSQHQSVMINRNQNRKSNLTPLIQTHQLQSYSQSYINSCCLAGVSVKVVTAVERKCDKMTTPPPAKYRRQLPPPTAMKRTVIIGPCYRLLSSLLLLSCCNLLLLLCLYSFVESGSVAGAQTLNAGASASAGLGVGVDVGASTATVTSTSSPAPVAVWHWKAPKHVNMTHVVVDDTSGALYVGATNYLLQFAGLSQHVTSHNQMHTTSLPMEPMAIVRTGPLSAECSATTSQTTTAPIESCLTHANIISTSSSPSSSANSQSQSQSNSNNQSVTSSAHTTSSSSSSSNSKQHIINNYNKILVIDTSTQQLIACGSALQGACRRHQLRNISAHSDVTRVPVAATDEQSSTLALVMNGQQQQQPLMYVGATNTRSGAERELVPALSARYLDATRHMQIVEKSFTDAARVDISFHLRDYFLVQYVYAFHTREHVYFASVQRRSHLRAFEDLGYATRLVRVCLNDHSFQSYAEVTLQCVNTQQHQRHFGVLVNNAAPTSRATHTLVTDYNIMTDATVVSASAQLASHLRQRDAVAAAAAAANGHSRSRQQKQQWSSHPMQLLVASFAASRDHTMRTQHKSAICVYPLDLIERKFAENINACFNGTTTSRNIDYMAGSVDQCPRHSSSSSSSSLRSASFSSLQSQHCNEPVKLNGTQPIVSVPVVTFDTELVTAVAATHSPGSVGTSGGANTGLTISEQQQQVLIVGTHSGRIKQLLVEPSWPSRSNSANSALNALSARQFDEFTIHSADIGDASQPILADMHVLRSSLAHQQHTGISEQQPTREWLVAATAHQLVRVPLGACPAHNGTTCGACAHQEHPNCGWCVASNSCTSRVACLLIPAAKFSSSSVGIHSGAPVRWLAAHALSVAQCPPSDEAIIDTSSSSVSILTSHTSADSVGSRALATDDAATGVEHDESSLVSSSAGAPVQSQSQSQSQAQAQMDAMRSSSRSRTASLGADWSPTASNSNNNNNVTVGLDELVIASGSRVALVVPVRNVMLFQAAHHNDTQANVAPLKLECLIEIEGARARLGARLTRNIATGNAEIVCNEHTFAYADDTPIVRASVQVMAVRHATIVERLEVVVYKCQWFTGPSGMGVTLYASPLSGSQGVPLASGAWPLLAAGRSTDCSLCQTIERRFECAWCNNQCTHSSSCLPPPPTSLTTSGQTRASHIASALMLSSSTWLASDDVGGPLSQCPPPRIDSIWPTSGPVEGGTLLIIEGANLGSSEREIQDKIAVGGIPCPLVEYSVSTRIVCRTGASLSGAQSGVVVVGNRAGVTRAQDKFHYKSVYLTEVSPSIGPMSGGTRLNLTGTNLNIGYRTEVYLDDTPCRIERNEASNRQITCITSPNTDASNARVTRLKLVIDNATHILPYPFVYVPDPVITSIGPIESFMSGGRLMIITGHNLKAPQSVRLMVHHEHRLSLVNSSTCVTRSDTLMTCLTPAITRSLLLSSTLANNNNSRADWPSSLLLTSATPALSSATNVAGQQKMQEQATTTIASLLQQQQSGSMTEMSGSSSSGGNNNNNDLLSDNRMIASGALKLKMSFVMDDVKSVRHLDEFYPHLPHHITYVDDPRLYPFPTIVVPYTSELIIDGEKLNLNKIEQDILVTIGTNVCQLSQRPISATQLVCVPPSQAPAPTDEEGRPVTPNEPQLPKIVAQIGSHLRFELGYMQYDTMYQFSTSPASGGANDVGEQAAASMLAPNMALLAGAGALGVLGAFIATMVLIMYKYRSTQAEREYKRIQLQMGLLDMNGHVQSNGINNHFGNYITAAHTMSGSKGLLQHFATNCQTVASSVNHTPIIPLRNGTTTTTANTITTYTSSPQASNKKNQVIFL